MCYRYKQYEKGGVAEFFADHNISALKLPLAELQSLIQRLETQLTHAPEKDFICTFKDKDNGKDIQLQFEGADEMGALHFYLMGCSRNAE